MTTHDTPTFTDEDGNGSTLPGEFATATMGHILLSQNRHTEARTIFLSVLAHTPNDPEAQRGMALLEPSPTPPPPTTTRHSPPQVLQELPADSFARTLAVDPFTLVLYWELSLSLFTHRGLATTNPSLSLLVVSFSPSPEGVSRTERRLDNLHPTGELYLRDLTPGATHHCAIGAFHNNRFVPLARTEPITTPRDTPSVPLSRLLPQHPSPSQHTPPPSSPPVFATHSLSPAPPFPLPTSPGSLATAEVFEHYLRASSPPLPTS